MARQTCNQFEPTTNTSSATICKWCGQEKFLHALKVDYMLQLTAVEWLEHWYNMGDGYDRHLTPNEFKQAKQMEKEQIINTYLNACSRVTPYGYYNDSAEQYYNETYNK